MNGSLRQRSAGPRELTVDLGRDGGGKRRRKYLTVRGTKAQSRRKLREGQERTKNLMRRAADAFVTVMDGGDEQRRGLAG